MRSDYEVMKRENDWVVHEAQTDQIIRAFGNEMDAQKYRKFLARGGAFNGYTPSFILNEEYRNQLILEEETEEVDINQKFEEIVFRIQG